MIKTKPNIDVYGNERWFNSAGQLHREDGPAFVASDAFDSKHSTFPFKFRWYKNGKLHRTDGPAVIYKDGSEDWYHTGLLHRTDGPAVTTSTGVFYYQFDELHRIDGPACINNDGGSQWYQHSKRHCDHGPAVITANGLKSWFINGERKNSEINAWMRRNKISYPFSEEHLIFFRLTWCLLY